MHGFVSLVSSAVNRQVHSAPPLRERRCRGPDACLPSWLLQEVMHAASALILPQDLTGKEIVLDIQVEDTNGHRFGVEMQLGRFYHWAQRNVYGIARTAAGLDHLSAA